MSSDTRTLLIALVMAVLTLGGCMLDGAGRQRPDGALPDAGPELDAAAIDAATVDAAGIDAGQRDGGGDAFVPRIDSGPDCVPRTEVCNGMDDDCDSSTPDGAADPMLGAACDAGDDLDLCADDALACVSGGLVCIDDGDDTAEIEICNGMDDDCDPSTPDGAADAALVGFCDGADADLCLEGTNSCTGGAIVCDDTSGDSAETCDGTDQDCDGSIDEGVDCGCDRVEDSGHSYLFCHSGGDQRSWTSARDRCRGRGYELVSIESLAEQTFVAMQAKSYRDDNDFWIGANDRDEHSSEGAMVWIDVPPRALTYTYWKPGEPSNSGGGGGEDCVEMDTGDNMTPLGTGVYGAWNDDDCGADNRYICEAGP